MNRHEYHPGASHRLHLASLQDCPVCRFGTVDRKIKGDRILYRCADCQRAWTAEQWAEVLQQKQGTK